MLAIILSILIVLAGITVLILLRRRAPYLAQLNAAVQNLFQTQFCGVANVDSRSVNNGPIWKRHYMPPCTNDNQEDFWLNGNMLETLANYTMAGGSDKHVPQMFQAMFAAPHTLDQLLYGWNGCWNDDRSWWANAFVSIYESDPGRYPDALKWATAIFNNIYQGSFNQVTCDARTFTTTWWQLDPNDPTGKATYRNCITNALFCQMAWRLGKHHGYSGVYEDVLRKTSDFLLYMYDAQNALMFDGMDQACKLTAKYFTYNQGICLFNFLVLYELMGDARFRAMSFAVVKRMTTLVVAAANCNLDVAARQDCIGNAGGDQKVCESHAECCFNNSFPNTLAPYCYKKDQSDLFHVVMDGTLIFREGEGGNDMNRDGSAPAFKGVFCRYLGYWVARVGDLSLSEDERAILGGARAFLKANANWVAANQSDAYSFYWSFKQGIKLPADTISTASTISALDLFLSVV